MKKEAYCSPEISMMLKKAGFDWDVHSLYGDKSDGDMGFSSWVNNYNSHDDLISAPTHQMACDWLTEEKNIYVTAVPDIGNSLRFYPAIYVIKGELSEEYWFEYINSVVKELQQSYCKPQQAIEAALEYVLTKLI